MFSVLIADCYHDSVEQEEKVFNSTGILFDVAMCRTEEELIGIGKIYDVLLVSYVNVSKKVISSLPKLKLIVKYGVGVDNIDIAFAKQAGVHVANVPDYCSEEVAVHAVALTLAGVRELSFFTAATKQGKWLSVSEKKPRRLSLLSLGLIGYGRIAKKYHSMMRNMVADTFIYDPYIQVKPKMNMFQCCSVGEVFQKADIVSVFIPLTSETRGIINKEVLEKASRLILINTSRGDILDYKSVISALELGHLSFLGSDVWWNEPDIDDTTAKLLTRYNIILTPHIGWCSEESEKDLRRKAALLVVDYILNGDDHAFIC